MGSGEDQIMTKTGAKTEYHLIADTDVPLHFWRSNGDSLETATCLEALADSMESYGACWLIWDINQQALYEQRDLYECSIVRVVEHDVIGGNATPCGDLRRRESLPIFFTVSQFWQIVAFAPSQDQSCTEACSPVACVV